MLTAALPGAGLLRRRNAHPGVFGGARCRAAVDGLRPERDLCDLCTELARGDTAILHCRWLSFLRDLHRNLACIAVIFCQNDGVALVASIDRHG